MRVHMLSQRLPPDTFTGAPLQAMGLARALNGPDCSVHLYCTGARFSASAAQYRQGLEVHTLTYPPLTSLQAPLRFAAAYLKASRIGAADIVHGHALSPMILGYALRRGPGAPPFLVKPSLGGAHGEGEIHKLRRFLPERLLRRAMQRIDAFAVLDDVIAADLTALGISESRMHRVDNGVDTQRFCPALPRDAATLRRDFGIAAHVPVLLFAGQLSLRKGLPELLEAWARLVDKGAEGVLAVCGSGPLQAQVVGLQQRLPGSVRYLGELADVVPAIRMADVLVLPSRWESFGNVIVEAMACGLPVAATATGVATRILQDGHTGWRITGVSVDAVERVLQRLLKVRDSWSALGDRALAAAREYDFTHIAGRYREIYARFVDVRTTACSGVNR